MNEYSKLEKLKHIDNLLNYPLSKNNLGVFLCERISMLDIDMDRFVELAMILDKNISNGTYLNRNYRNIFYKYVDKVEHLDYLSKSLYQQYLLEVRKVLLINLKGIIENINNYPKKWEDINVSKGYFVSSERHEIDNFREGSPAIGGVQTKDKGIIRTLEQTESIYVLPEILQLRDAYRDGWTPNYKDITQIKYCIEFNDGKVKCQCYRTIMQMLSFQSEYVRDLFLNRFNDKLFNYFKGLE